MIEIQMRAVERDLDRILNHLRNLIRQHGFTQLEVQEVLGWGRSYISQLLTKQKTLRMEQILLILNVINVKPEDFWAELFQFGPFGETGTADRDARHRAAPAIASLDDSTPGIELQRMVLLYKGIVTVLKRKNLIVADDLTDAIESARSGHVVLQTD